MSIQHKIVRTANAPTTPPDELETAVAQALVDLENSVPELKMELRPLQMSAVREIDVRGGKKAIVIFVPVPQLQAFHKVQARCVCHSRAGGCGGGARASGGAIPSSLAQAQQQAD
jgi:small subunit ribosomal protein S7e